MAAVDEVLLVHARQGLTLSGIPAVPVSGRLGALVPCAYHAGDPCRAALGVCPARIRSPGSALRARVSVATWTEGALAAGEGGIPSHLGHSDVRRLGRQQPAPRQA